MTLTEEQIKTALKDPQHLRRWAEETRPWLIFRSTHLVDALPWPDGHEALQQIISAYRMYRARIESGETQTVRDPLSGTTVEVATFLTELPSRDELDAAIRYLVRQITDLEPTWRL